MHLQKLKQRHRSLTTGLTVKKKLAESLPTEGGAWHSKLQGVQQNKNKAFEIWNAKEFKKYEEYHKYYLKLEVLLLADIFQLFRRNAMQANLVDPCYFQGIPGYTLYCAVMHNPDKLRIIPQHDIYLLIQQNIRGGVAKCTRRYATVNNENESISYLDVNSL